MKLVVILPPAWYSVILHLSLDEKTRYWECSRTKNKFGVWKI